MPSDRSQIFSPSAIQGTVARQRQLKATLSDVSDTQIESTSSFTYSRPGDGLRSTQQLNVDWSRFENHTFFNSAEVKTNIAFDKIVNGYPFDGTRAEHEKFFEGLTGFEKWVYDRFPKNVGYLNFSGSSGTTGGTYLSVQGTNGTSYPTLSQRRQGTNVLDQGNRSFTIEMHVSVPSGSQTSTQVICQKQTGTAASTHGFSLVLLLTGSQASVGFGVYSGSAGAGVSAPIQAGSFRHVCAVFSKTGKNNRALLYVDGQLAADSGQQSVVSLGDLGNGAAPLLIGSGSAFTAGQLITPTATFSGSIDEFRFFHSARTPEQINAYARKTLYGGDDLKLYFKFNEPSGSLISGLSEPQNGIVIDSSGNELHSTVSNFSFRLRSTSSVDVPMIYENKALSPVLFPGFADTVALNRALLLSASSFDDANKNIITKLVPPHYFREGKDLNGFDNEDGTIGDGYTGTTPRQGQLGTSQVFSSFLYVWAKFFDELKLYVDSFVNVKYVGYESANTAPDVFLPMLIKSYGFTVPSFFNDASLEQFVRAENINSDFGTNQHALQYVQNQIHRRVLVNLLNVIRSKGTQHSVKSFIRSLGIDPDNSFRIKEFGGPTRRNLDSARESRTEVRPVVDMRDGTGLFVSAPLSASRVETGFPYPQGPMVQQGAFPPHGISSNPADGLLTSGSFTIEGLYRFPAGKQTKIYATQSLARLAITGSDWGGTRPTYLNIVATSGTLGADVPTVSAYLRLSADSAVPTLALSVTGSDVFDGNKWHVSFGCVRNDEIGTPVSSSYFLRVARQSEGDIAESYVTSSFWCDQPTAGNTPITRKWGNTSNPSGSYLIVGNENVFSTVGALFLNDSTLPAIVRAGTFQGQFSNLRFWSRAVPESEWREHVRNPNSIGVSSPLVNFNFEKAATGSFGRLRLDATADQDSQYAGSAGSFTLTDFSQNGLNMAGAGFSSGAQVLRNDVFQYTFISPSFDEAATSNKVRVRSFQDSGALATNPAASLAPVYEPDPTETPTDNTKFAIEFSLVDALNRDIVNIFGTLDELDSALGNPELLFSDTYPDLDRLRFTYFNRLTDKLNFRGFFEYFRWFDESVGRFIEQLIPRKARFTGANYVIESHALERSRTRYHHYGMYLGEKSRVINERDTLLQLLAGSVKRF